MKFAKYLLYALMAISVVFIVIFYVQNSTGAFRLVHLKALAASTNMIDGILYWTYLLVGLAIVALLLLAIIGMVKNPKSLKRAGFTVLLAVVLCVVSYLLASGDPVAANVTKAPTETALKLTDTGLIMTYILLAVAFLALIFGGVFNAIKKR